MHSGTIVTVTISRIVFLSPSSWRRLLRSPVRSLQQPGLPARGRCPVAARPLALRVVESDVQVALDGIPCPAAGMGLLGRRLQVGAGLAGLEALATGFLAWLWLV